MKKLIFQNKVLMLMNTSLSSTYAPMVAEAQRAKVPLYFAGSVCPKDTYPPADPVLFCSTAFGANLDSQAALAFVKHSATEPVRLGLAAMAIPIARGEIDYAEGLSKTLGMTPVEKQITPPPTPDYTPFATKLKEANPNWVYSWSPWVSQVRTFEALRRLGWNGRYITWAHLNAEDDLARVKDNDFYVIGTNALFQDNLPIQAEIRAVAHRTNISYPTTYLTEGYIAGMVIEAALRKTPWPATPAKSSPR
jgi:ABC-type branched-subunit amino acid transport system substrate-binding protein